MNAITSFANLIQSTQHKVIRCDDPCHNHNSPTQDMYALVYCGHQVAVTRDGHEWSVRIDGNPLTDKHRLSWDEVTRYVEAKCR